MENKQRIKSKLKTWLVSIQYSSSIILLAPFSSRNFSKKKRLSAVFIKNVVGKCADLGAPSRGDSGVSFLSDGFSQLSLRFIVVQWKNKKKHLFYPFFMSP